MLHMEAVLHQNHIDQADLFLIHQKVTMDAQKEDVVLIAEGMVDASAIKDALAVAAIEATMELVVDQGDITNAGCHAEMVEDVQNMDTNSDADADDAMEE